MKLITATAEALIDAAYDEVQDEAERRAAKSGKSIDAEAKALVLEILSVATRKTRSH